ncbi:UDP-glucose--hexose-1-phosphate uridylyltransferase [Bacillota bacterium Meth-B3]
MKNTTYYIERLIAFAVDRALLEREDWAYARNLLLDAMGLDAPEAAEADDAPLPDTVTGIIEPLARDAAARGLIEDTADARGRFGARLCGLITPAPQAVRERFRALYEREGARAATDWFYRLCRACDYIKVDRIESNVRFVEDSPAGPLEITINLSKPEKDPRDIAAALTAPRLSYPACMLCVENPGYAGRPGFPARQNHRMVPLTLHGERFYLQYSPYLYYDEHNIVLSDEHRPMAIGRGTFARLLEFVDRFPHYFLGSNADLPIVGGSILSHDHFQGGAHRFPMDAAGALIPLAGSDPRVQAEIVDWPMSCVRLSGEDASSLIDASVDMLDAWRAYSDESLGILAHTDQPHNTITPIARREGNRYIVNLVLRNNRVNAEHPLGIFHPHADLHHVKKENIGLIEVMGLFILPGRLIGELHAARDYLTYARALGDAPGPDEPVAKHYAWIREIAPERALREDEADALIRRALAEKCARVLADAGVYKRDQAGRAGFLRFVGGLGYRAIV